MKPIFGARDPRKLPLSLFQYFCIYLFFGGVLCGSLCWSRRESVTGGLLGLLLTGPSVFLAMSLRRRTLAPETTSSSKNRTNRG